MSRRRGVPPKFLDTINAWNKNVIARNLQHLVISDIGEPTCAACRSYFNGIYDAPAEIWESTSCTSVKVEKTWKAACDKAHIVPSALGGSDTDPDNFAPLCRRCNNLDPHITDVDKWFEWADISSRSNMIDGMYDLFSWLDKNSILTGKI